MVRALRLALFLALVILPIVFYKSFHRAGRSQHPQMSLFFPAKDADAFSRPKIALIFDDLGESLKELKDLYALKIPLTISIIPDLKFSKNIGHIASRCGFTVFIHLPFEPEKSQGYQTSKYRFINSGLSKREIESLVKSYLNSLRMAVGVNNHMGSKATKDSRVMDIALNEIKKQGLIFIDSRTSLESIAYELADKKGLVCGYNEGFLDAADDPLTIEERMLELSGKAKEKGKIIVIAHPRKNTLKFLKENLKGLQKEIDFITIKDYFGL